MGTNKIKIEDKLLDKKKSKTPKKEVLHEEEYEYLKSDNGNYKDYPSDSSSGGTATVQKVGGTMAKTRSPIDTKSCRNNWWMDRGEGGGGTVLPRHGILNCSMITNKKNLKEAVKVLKALNERDVIKVPGGQEQMPPPADGEMGGPPMDNGSGAPPMDDGMGGAPPMDDGVGGDMGAGAPPAGGDSGNPDLDRLMELLQANPDRVEGILNYAKGIIGDDNVPEGGDAPPADDGMGGDMGAPPADPNAAPGGPPPQTESRMSLDELINDYIGTKEKPKRPTITPNLGGSDKSLKSKMFRPISK